MRGLALPLPSCIIQSLLLLPLSNIHLKPVLHNHILSVSQTAFLEALTCQAVQLLYTQPCCWTLALLSDESLPHGCSLPCQTLLTKPSQKDKARGPTWCKQNINPNSGAPLPAGLWDSTGPQVMQPALDRRKKESPRFECWYLSEVAIVNQNLPFICAGKVKQKTKQGLNSEQYRWSLAWQK